MTVVLEETKQHDETVVLKRRPCFRLPFHPAKYDQEAIEMLTLLKEESSEATVEEARLLDSLHDLNQASKLLSQQEQRKEKLVVCGWLTKAVHRGELFLRCGLEKAVGFRSRLH